MTKIIAFYLPQFHEIPENDKWWGKGFTEWTNVKKAKSLYKGHYQPREPLNDYYYNLTSENAISWQVNLAKKYGVYGFCYYHYWFNGKLLLEKPLEKLIEKKDVDFPFCICWANEPWTRSWDGKSDEVLIDQSYGDKQEWKEHFEYLIKIFKDSRYIKIDNKPVFVVYRTESILRCSEMIEYWNNLLIECGFNGIYFVEMLNSFQKNCFSENSNAYIEFEPMYTLAYAKPNWLVRKRRLYFKIKNSRLGKLIKDKPDCFSYDTVWRLIFKRKRIVKNKEAFLGAFAGWDNTPRKGLEGMVIKGSTPEKFEKYLAIQIKNLKQIKGNSFIFINAWNEWSEGTYLEPDKKNGYKYLEAIKNALK